MTSTIKIIIGGFLLFVGNISYGQDKPIAIELSAIKTELKQSAIGAGVRYVKSLDSLFKEQDILMTGDNFLFQITPQFNVQTGTEDAFSSVNAKLTGLFMTFHTTTVAEQLTPDLSRGFQTFPVSIGLETNNRFDVLNGIAEVGWVPWYQTEGNKKTPNWLKRTRMGIFIQGGYKFDINKQPALIEEEGGDEDKSKEELDKGIFRAKASVGVNTNSLFELSGVGVGLVGDGDVWYDIINNQIYYTVQGKLRFYLTKNKDRFFDFKYQKGSGAPNFNEGDQYGLGLTVTF